MYLIVIVTFIIVKWLSVTGDIKKVSVQSSIPAQI